MREFFPLIFSLAAIAVAGLVEIMLMALINRPWWSRRWVRRVSWGLPLFGMVMVLVWGLGQYYAVSWLRLPAAGLAVLAFVLEAALMLSLPISGVIHFIHWLTDRIVKKRQTADPSITDNNRRAFLRIAAVGLPAASVSLGLTGLTHAFTEVAVFLKTIRFENLPVGLDGLRILHLSDSHLANYVTLDAIEEVLLKAESFQPDLIAVSGDIADDLTMLGDCLKLISQLKPRYGVYASLGNHEYYRGLRRVQRIFEASPVPLLVNHSLVVNVSGVDLRIAGIEDPRFVSAGDRAFFKQAIDIMLTEARTADFTLLLSHRPLALDYASEVGLDLVLAGHTHGGQIGFRRHSFFELFNPDTYLWGHYQKNDTHLYTSSGVGHWFPFRLGCPAEAPVLELTRG